MLRLTHHALLSAFRNKVSARAFRARKKSLQETLEATIVDKDHLIENLRRQITKLQAANAKVRLYPPATASHTFGRSADERLDSLVRSSRARLITIGHHADRSVSTLSRRRLFCPRVHTAAAEIFLGPAPALP
jgi:hypothetical protein